MCLVEESTCTIFFFIFILCCALERAQQAKKQQNQKKTKQVVEVPCVLWFQFRVAATIKGGALTWFAITLSAMGRAYDQLVATSCKYRNIPDLCKIIDSFLFAHPASCLITALTFEYLPGDERGDIYKVARLCVRSRKHGSYARTYSLQDLGMRNMACIRLSDRASNIARERRRD